MAIRLHGHHAGTGLGQRQRQRAQARSDLEHVRARTGAREPGNATDGVRVSDEILPEGTARPQTVRRQQLCDVGAGKGHQEIVTPTTPWLVSAICEKPSGERSTTRG